MPDTAAGGVPGQGGFPPPEQWGQILKMLGIIGSGEPPQIIPPQPKQGLLTPPPKVGLSELPGLLQTKPDAGTLKEALALPLVEQEPQPEIIPQRGLLDDQENSFEQFLLGLLGAAQ